MELPSAFPLVDVASPAISNIVLKLETKFNRSCV
jgi:hypothetical protein